MCRELPLWTLVVLSTFTTFAFPSDKAKKGLITKIEKSHDREPHFVRIPGRIHTHSLVLGIGQSFLYGKLGKYGADSITLDALYTFSASYSFSFFVNSHYSVHKKDRDKEKTKLQGLAPGIKAHLWQFDSLSPYTLGGLGFYATRTTDGEGKRSGKGILLGLHAGVGIDLVLNRNIVTGILLHVHNPFSSETRSHKESEGYYGKMMLNIGYIF